MFEVASTARGLVRSGTSALVLACEFHISDREIHRYMLRMKRFRLRGGAPIGCRLAGTADLEMLLAWPDATELARRLVTTGFICYLDARTQFDCDPSDSLGAAEVWAVSQGRNFSLSSLRVGYLTAMREAESAAAAICGEYP